MLIWFTSFYLHAFTLNWSQTMILCLLEKKPTLLVFVNIIVLTIKSIRSYGVEITYTLKCLLICLIHWLLNHNAP